VEPRQRRTRPPDPRYLAPAVCGLLLLAVGLVFGQTVRHGFVKYDDDEYVYENPQVVRGLTAEGIGWAFTHIHGGNWHPLTDRKSTRLNSSHLRRSRMPSSA